MSLLRSVCQLRVATPKPCLHPSIFFFSFSRWHTHIPTHTSFSRTFRFHPPSLPLLPSMSIKAKASYGTGGSGAEGGRARELLVQHLLVKEDDQKLLLELQQRISAGEDLSDLAVEYSMCPSKEEGGMLGWVGKGQMAVLVGIHHCPVEMKQSLKDIITVNFLWIGGKGVPEFEEAAFSAPLNKVVRCKTKFGWHLLQVLSEREGSILQDIQPDELHVKIQDPRFLEEAQLIDVREPEEVAKASLPGFTVLPLRQFGSWGPEIVTKFDPQKDTYVMCHHGMRSLQVAKWLQSQGFRKVYNLAGGIHAYAVQVDPSVPTY
ncbi:Rhodanese-like/PpiC domain-containing protein 12, chloroplastic [Mucuna pruriens]|uniref:Rhodanese-like/PpiC domain-containing protein 12, chloroplastic n=1 Tax=Mucuna pruriens TaxID=157652 RepID=A0A371I0T6_MUCPR|nr:Rhodanese-like/PpiC domain-containing protein 12, chloroplastic [Mucuna pruriens]